jgi:outer membrane cobalamin receptor
MKQFVWLSIAVVAAAACGGKASPGSQAPAPSTAPASAPTSRTAAPTTAANAPAKKSGPNLITYADIQKQDFRNAQEVVQRLRPQWLRGRGSVSLSDRNGESTLPLIYVDGVKYGTMDMLGQIPVTQINELQFISASDATTRWGTGLPGGVILVISKGGKR